MNDILFQEDAGVMTLTFNRVDRKNAITSAMYQALVDALSKAETDAAVRVVLVRGDPKIFTAGNDIGDFLGTPEARSAEREEERPVWRFMRSIATFPKPLLAAVCGPAVGVGTTMLFHCDLVYAGDNANFSMPFVNLGLVPEAGSSLLAPAMMGYHRAADALLFGEPFGVDVALRTGLVNEVVQPVECNAMALRQAMKLASKPLAALMETKRLLRMSQQPAVLQRMTEEVSRFTRMLREPAAHEALTAFVEKRKPNFTGL